MVVAPRNIFGQRVGLLDIFGGVGAAISTPVKLATIAVTGAAAAGIIWGGKGYLAQQQTETAVTGGYTITAQPGSTVNIEKPTTGQIAQEQTATATQSQPDYLQWLLIGGVGIAALWVFMRGRKK